MWVTPNNGMEYAYDVDENNNDYSGDSDKKDNEYSSQKLELPKKAKNVGQNQQFKLY